MERGRRQKVNTLGLNEIKHFISHIWLGIFVVCNFRYWEIVDILFIVRLQIKNMYVCLYVWPWLMGMWRWMGSHFHDWTD